MTTTRVDEVAGKDMYLGETAKQGIDVTLGEGESIATATYQRFKADGTKLDVAPLQAQKLGGNVFAYVPATEAGAQYVQFVYTIGQEVRIARVTYNVVE